MIFYFIIEDLWLIPIYRKIFIHSSKRPEGDCIHKPDAPLRALLVLPEPDHTAVT
jgi:hypothetical protein